jgi:hypothetical protein
MGSSGHMDLEIAVADAVLMAVLNTREDLQPQVDKTVIGQRKIPLSMVKSVLACNHNCQYRNKP